MGSGTEARAPDGRPSPVSRHAAPQFRALPPLTLYVHLPYCARKCPYCDFNSHEVRGALPEERYVAALVADLERALPQVWGRPVYSVFIGGGTPSLFSARSVDAILAAVRARLPLAPEAEVTLEANPGTAEADKFRDFRAAGVNRLSLGVQSFHPVHLRSLGRIHDDAQARRAIDFALGNFDEINIDLMYGLPGQTVAEAQADLQTALAYAPAHLSCYHLTVEPNTRFQRFPPDLPDDDTAAMMQEAVETRLAEAGYIHYETSAFARLRGMSDESGEPSGERQEAVGMDRTTDTLPRLSPGPSPVACYCRHNLNYWQFGDYLGIGAGAHAKVSFPGLIVREARLKHPVAYMQAVEEQRPAGEAQAVEVHDLGFEFMMNALRLTGGFPLALVEERTGMPVATVLRELDEAERRGFIERDHARVVPTPAGRRFLNDLLQIFLPEATRCRPTGSAPPSPA